MFPSLKASKFRIKKSTVSSPHRRQCPEMVLKTMDLVGETIPKKKEWEGFKWGKHRSVEGKKG